MILFRQVAYRGRTYPDITAALMAAYQDIAEDFEGLPYFYERDLKDYLDKSAQDVTREWKPWTEGRKSYLQNRTGKTKKAILKSPTTKRTDRNKFNAHIKGTLGGPEYLNLLEDGGTVRARGGGYMAIPLTAALDNRGVPKRKSVRDWKKTFLTKASKGRFFVCQKRNGRVVRLYILQRTVKYRPLLGMGRTMQKNMSFFADRLVESTVKNLERYY